MHPHNCFLLTLNAKSNGNDCTLNCLEPFCHWTLWKRNPFLTLLVHSHLKLNPVKLFLSMLSFLMPVKGSMTSSLDHHLTLSPSTLSNPSSTFLLGLPTLRSRRQCLSSLWLVIFPLCLLIPLCQDDRFSLMKTLERFSVEKIFQILGEERNEETWTTKPEVYISLMPQHHQGDQ